MNSPAAQLYWWLWVWGHKLIPLYLYGKEKQHLPCLSFHFFSARLLITHHAVKERGQITTLLSFIVSVYKQEKAHPLTSSFHVPWHLQRIHTEGFSSLLSWCSQVCCLTYLRSYNANSCSEWVGDIWPGSKHEKRLDPWSNKVPIINGGKGIFQCTVMPICLSREWWVPHHPLLNRKYQKSLTSKEQRLLCFAFYWQAHQTELCWKITSPVTEAARGNPQPHLQHSSHGWPVDNL